MSLMVTICVNWARAIVPYEPANGVTTCSFAGHPIVPIDRSNLSTQARRQLRSVVDLTHHNKNRSITVPGPEIIIRPVATRSPTWDDSR